MLVNFNSLRIVTLSVLLLFCGSLSTADAGSHDTLFALINERLSYMEQVALYKNYNKLAVEDLERERLVIDNSKRSAARLGLDSESTETFFAAQIAVAKAIQYRHMADWLSMPATGQPPDLTTRIRPALTELGDQIIDNLATLLHSGESIGEQHRQAFYTTISVRHVEESDKALLFDSLVKVNTRARDTQ